MGVSIVLAVLAAGATGLVAHRWFTMLVAERTEGPLAGRARTWVSRTVLTVGSAGAGMAWMAPVPVPLRVALVLAGIIAWWLVCVDAAIHRLPDPLVGALATVLGAGFAWLYVTDQAANSQIVSAVTGGALALLVFLFLALTRSRAMGLGDVKLAGVLGFATGWFGWEALGQWVILSFLTGGVFAALLLFTRRVGPRDSIAFGPWLILSAAAVIALSMTAGVTH